MAVLRAPTRVGGPLAVAVSLLTGGCAAVGPVGAQGRMVYSGFSGRPLMVASRSSGGGVGGPERLGSREASASEGAPARPDAAAVEHVVEPGQTLWGISRQYGVTVHALSKANGIDDPALVRVGQRLKVPGGEADATPQSDAANGSASPSPRPGSTTRRPTAKPTPGPAAGAEPHEPTKTSGAYPLLWPVAGKVTSRFGKRWGRSHDGIDIGAAAGSPVRAAANGEVMYSAAHGSYGNLVILKHVGGLVTVYAHNRINLVRKGQRVKAGQMIAKVGQTGRSSGPHLHFEVRRGTSPQNPMALLPP